jgi:hypothetical protein
MAEVALNRPRIHAVVCQFRQSRKFARYIASRQYRKVVNNNPLSSPVVTSIKVERSVQVTHRFNLGTAIKVMLTAREPNLRISNAARGVASICLRCRS